MPGPVENRSQLVPRLIFPITLQLAAGRTPLQIGNRGWERVSRWHGAVQGGHGRAQPETRPLGPRCVPQARVLLLPSVSPPALLLTHLEALCIFSLHLLHWERT